MEIYNSHLLLSQHWFIQLVDTGRMMSLCNISLWVTSLDSSELFEWLFVVTLEFPLKGFGLSVAGLTMLTKLFLNLHREVFHLFVLLLSYYSCF